jgi:hypothetical protein
VRILQSLVDKEYSNLEEISVFITLLAAHDSSYIHLCMELARKSRIRTTKKERKEREREQEMRDAKPLSNLATTCTTVCKSAAGPTRSHFPTCRKTTGYGVTQGSPFPHKESRPRVGGRLMLSAHDCS